MRTFLVCAGALAVLFSGVAVIQYQGVIKNFRLSHVPLVVENVFSNAGKSKGVALPNSTAIKSSGLMD